MKTTISRWLLALLLSSGFFAQGNAQASLLTAGSPLVTALAGTGNHNTLASLLQTPGLGKLLGSAVKNPFTLLAPTDLAFNALGQSVLTSLTKPENLKVLAGILSKHIVPGKLDPASLAKGGFTNAAGKGLNLGGANMGEMIGADKYNIIPVDKVLP